MYSGQSSTLNQEFSSNEEESEKTEIKVDAAEGPYAESQNASAEPNTEHFDAEESGSNATDSAAAVRHESTESNTEHLADEEAGRNLATTLQSLILKNKELKRYNAQLRLDLCAVTAAIQGESNTDAGQTQCPSSTGDDTDDDSDSPH